MFKIGLLSIAFLLSSAQSFDFQVDSTKIGLQYRNGDFDKIDLALKPILKPEAICSLNDSIIAWKYLAVVYAANPATREKGRYCMLRLLELDPASNFLDLYVGEKVDQIFDKARREHELTQHEPLTSPQVAENALGIDKAMVTPVSTVSESENRESDPPEFKASTSRKVFVTMLAASAVAGLVWYSWENAPATEKTYHAFP